MDPIVSIICVTYNHEKYLVDALESFLRQETSFPYEIIIHDDASTDKTADIIRQYAKKYPSLIKPIYQKENQHSQGIKTATHIAPVVKGKYVAMCEGDDYWLNKHKIQKQFNFLEDNPDYISCFHAVSIVDVNKNATGRYYGPMGGGSKELTLQDTVVGGALHISSIFYRSEYYKNEKPLWFMNAIHGDYALALYLSAEGRIFFIDEAMSAYRTGVENSMMTNFRKNYSKQNDIKYHKNRIETLEMADKYYHYRFHDEIEKVNSISELHVILLENNFSSSSRKTIKKYAKYYGWVSFIKKYLGNRFPRIYAYLAKMKRSLDNS